MNWLGQLFTGLGAGIVSIVDGWSKRQTVKVEGEVRVAVARAEAEVAQLAAQARLAETAQTVEANWDQLVAAQMERTWKDEFYVLLFSVPLVLAFVHPPIVVSGFEALDGMPAWYFYSIGTMIAATFGMRRLLSLFEKVRAR